MTPLVEVVLSTGGVVGGVAGIRFLRGYFDRRPARRAIAKTPALSATSDDGTRVVVTGVVRAVETTTVAPLSGRSCVLARARVRIMQKGLFGIGTYPYETFAIAPFVVETEQFGNVRVESRYAVLDLPSRGVPARRCAPGARQRLLDEHSVHDGTRSTPLFDEAILESGTTVAVAGLLMKDAAPQPSIDETDYRADRVILVLRGTVDHPIAVTATKI